MRSSISYCSDIFSNAIIIRCYSDIMFNLIKVYNI